MNLKKRLFFSICFGILAVLLLYLSFSLRTPQNDSPFTVSVDDSMLIYRSDSGYDHFLVYQMNDLAVVHATSDSAFFDGAEYLIETDTPLRAEDISVTWTAVSGVETDDPSEVVFGEICITQNGKELLREKINFVQKGTDALGEALSENQSATP